MVPVDQRGCGDSVPDAAEVDTDLSVNTTDRLVEDFERVREHLGIARWVIVGASWGAALAQACTAAHCDGVPVAVLFSSWIGSWIEIN